MDRRLLRDGYKPFSKFDMVVLNPRAMICSVMTPTSRFPVSMSEICPRFISRLTAISVWVHLLTLRNVRIRFPSWARSACLSLDILPSCR